VDCEEIRGWRIAKSNQSNFKPKITDIAKVIFNYHLQLIVSLKIKADKGWSGTKKKSLVVQWYSTTR